MDIKDCRIDLLVRTRAGRTGIIKEINNAGVVINLVGGGEHGAAFNCIEPVSDPCAPCEMAATITSQCKQIAELQHERDQWKVVAAGNRRNAAYWRAELTKLQNEALTECPNWQPELSQAARRVIEYMTAMNRPLYIGGILEGMKDIMSGMVIMDGIMEARDAGRIRLIEGKYEIVRD